MSQTIAGGGFLQLIKEAVSVFYPSRKAVFQPIGSSARKKKCRVYSKKGHHLSFTKRDNKILLESQPSNKKQVQKA